jgi:hypothetical protein
MLLSSPLGAKMAQFNLNMNRISALRGSALLRTLMLLIAAVTLLVILFSPPELHNVPILGHFVSQPVDTKVYPEKIIALVFFGRREFVSVLDCYLRVGLLGYPRSRVLTCHRETLSTTVEFLTR